MPIYVENQLHFSFPDTLNWEKLDQQGARIPTGMALADLVIERETDLLVVEIKDPSHSYTPQEERKRYIRRLQSNSLINEELTPKARDSYTFLHLMMRDEKPIIYILVLGLDAFDHATAKGILFGLRDRLFGSIKQECDSAWKRKHIQDCMVLSIEKWNERFPGWTVQRVISTK